MYLRTTKVAGSGGKSYRYAQLVESKRRKTDGMVVKDVVANLGQLDDLEIANLRLALKASKQGKRIVAAQLDARPPTKPDQSLRYLDIAVLLELWRKLGLDAMLDELMPTGGAAVAPADVVAALVIHRLVSPGSKLDATRWFGKTALPELLGIPENALENTRLHGVLDKLDGATKSLMRRLPTSYLDDTPAFSTIFMDVTDAWFVGRGPEELAKFGRGKDHVIRRMISILLVCNEYGYPLRWQVLAGDHAETTAMLAQYRELSHVRWAKQIPVVVDRALGRTAYIEQLLETGICFVTALVRSQIPGYVKTLPTEAVAQCPLPPSRKGQGEALGACIENAGFSKVDETLYFKDLGLVEHEAKPEPTVFGQTGEDRCRFALEAVHTCFDAVEAGTASSLRAASQELGLKAGVFGKYKRLAGLNESLKSAVLEGKAHGLPLARLIAIAEKPPHEQAEAFDAFLLLKRANARPKASPSKISKQKTIRLRAVAYFNPEMFLSQREKASQKLDRIDEQIRKLNDQLASPRSRRTRDKVIAAVDRILHKAKSLDVYDVEVKKTGGSGRPLFEVILTLRTTEWARRRSLDGFSALVTRPDFDLPAEEICQAYRSKDVVETDFRVIKSCVSLRPIWHHNEEKVRAHVTLCMLALLLERTLRRMLGDHATSMTALEELRDCPLNRYASPSGDSVYLITRPSQNQEALLKSLGMPHLVDDQQMSEALHSR